jgi:hypothetical protein
LMTPGICHRPCQVHALLLSLVDLFSLCQAQYAV